MTGICGQCGANVQVPMTAWPVEVTDSSFDKRVRMAPGPVLVEFWSPSCGHCIRMEGAVNELARDLAGRITVAKMDISSNRNTPSKFDITGTPAFLLFKDGVEKTRVMGAVPKEELARQILAFI